MQMRSAFGYVGYVGTCGNNFSKRPPPSIINNKSRRKKFHIPNGRSVQCKAAGFLYRVTDEKDKKDEQEDEETFDSYDDYLCDFDGLIVTEDKYRWAADLENIRCLNLRGKCVSILGMDSPDNVMPPTWMEIMELRNAFIQSGAGSVEYVYYEDGAFHQDL